MIFPQAPPHSLQPPSPPNSFGLSDLIFPLETCIWKGVTVNPEESLTDELYWEGTWDSDSEKGYHVIYIFKVTCET